MAAAAEATAICKNYINGEWKESASTKIAERRNPANTDDIVARVTLSTRDQAKQAIVAAKAALSGWRATSAPVRGNILFKAARLMDEQKTELARTLTREEGKALKDALGEVQRSINIMEFMAGEARRLTGETLPSELPRNFSYTVRQPVGVVGVITPWNFPLAIPVWKIAPALVCGNTVVFKPATLTPLCAVRLAQIFEQAGLPAGVLNLVTGSGKDVGDEIVTNPHVQAVSFTGSNAVGSDLYATGAAGMKKIQCEMGGKNPIVILADADLQLAMESALFGAFASSGQRCTATSRVIIEESVADKWIAMLVDRAKKFVAGDGLDPAVEMGPLVDENQMASVLRYIEIGKRETELKCGGERLTGSRYDKGWFVAPTVFDHVPANSTIAQEEIFGPVLSVIRVKNFDEAIEAANSVRYGLTSSIYTIDANKIFEFVEKSDAGMVHVNSPTVGGEAHVPFGGTKGTSVGPKEVGRSALDFYSELKIVYIDYTGRKRESSIY
ncbi:MAG TPA: aldehyde dehydrogenase family protein [Candidatus Acidoferrales bacterium]|nr:aldehyde dehydrogenase family protein [Candidatus Acidoferrales bacterium]